MGNCTGMLTLCVSFHRENSQLIMKEHRIRNSIYDIVNVAVAKIVQNLEA